MNKKILIGVLDWGLGHATRCIPLIDYLLQFQCQIFIAAAGPQKKLLETRYPGLQFLQAPSYAVKYPENKHIAIEVGKQMPKLIKVIRDEHVWLEEQRRKLSLDLVISDNRYGLWSDSIPSVIMTHQLSPISGFGGVADRIIRTLHYRFLQKFRECWVPDQEEHPGLAGKLSHPGLLPPNTRYIGPLSRMELLPSPAGDDGLLAMVSGPESSRTDFEELLLQQLPFHKEPYLLVRGLPADAEPGPPNTSNHLDAVELNLQMSKAALVICRSGYTSIMDLVKLKKRAVLVPTPGQTEQEYLAAHLQEHSVFPYIEQKKFSLEKALELANQFPYQWPQMQFDGYRKAIDELLDT